MAKSIRSKRMRKFRAIKREVNSAVENRRLQSVTKKLGTNTEEVQEEPKRFSFTAPKSAVDEQKEKSDPDRVNYLQRSSEVENWTKRSKEKMNQAEKAAEKLKERRATHRVNRKLGRSAMEGQEGEEKKVDDGMEIDVKEESLSKKILKSKVGKSGVKKQGGFKSKKAGSKKAGSKGGNKSRK